MQTGVVGMALMAIVACTDVSLEKPELSVQDTSGTVNWGEPPLAPATQTAVSLDGGSLTVTTTDCDVSDTDVVSCLSTITLTLPESAGVPLDHFFVLSKTVSGEAWCPDQLNGACLEVDLPLWPMRTESGRLRHAFVEAISGVYVSSVPISFPIGDELSFALDSAGGEGSVYAQVVIGSPVVDEPAMLSDVIELAIERPCSVEPDCAGVCLGSSAVDMCGVCDDDPANDCTEDCAGAWGGPATFDMCGVCDDDPANDCAEDCAGTWGGTATFDMCGVCDDDPTNDCIEDCAGAWGGSATFDMCGVCDDDPSNDCTEDCAGVWGGTSFIDTCGDCVAFAVSSTWLSDSFDAYDDSIWSELPATCSYEDGRLIASGNESFMRTREARPFREAIATLERFDYCDDHLLAISPLPDLDWSWTSAPDVVKLGWNCRDKRIYAPDSSPSTLCDERGAFGIQISVEDGILTFADDACESISANYPFGDDDVYLYIGGDCDGCGSEWLELVVRTEETCFEDCAGVPDGTAYEDMCGVCDDDPTNDCEMDCFGVWGGTGVLDACDECRDPSELSTNWVDDFDSWDADIWNTLPDGYTYSDGRLLVSGDASSAPELMRTRSTGTVSRILGAVDRDDYCDDHFVMLSTDPAADWTWGSEDNLKVAYNCLYLAVVGRETSISESCDAYGSRNFSVSIDAAGVTVTDSVCGSVTLEEDWTFDEHYVYVGADNDLGTADWEQLTVSYAGVGESGFYDSFDGYDAAIWTTPSDRYAYVGGELQVSGGAGEYVTTPHLRTVEPMSVTQVQATLNKSDDCSDHFIMLSREPEEDWRWSGMESGTVRIAWNCTFKYIFGQMESVYVDCPELGVNSLDIQLDDDTIVFSDDRCGDLEIFDAIGRLDEMYVYVGADQDTAGLYSSWLDFGVTGTIDCATD